MFSLPQFIDTYVSLFSLAPRRPPCIAERLLEELRALDFDKGWEAVEGDFRRVEGYISKAMTDFGNAKAQLKSDRQETGSESRSESVNQRLYGGDTSN